MNGMTATWTATQIQDATGLYSNAIRRYATRLGYIGRGSGNYLKYVHADVEAM